MPAGVAAVSSKQLTGRAVPTPQVSQQQQQQQQREPVERRGSVAQQSPVAALDMRPPGGPAAPQEGGSPRSSPRRGSVARHRAPQGGGARGGF